MGLDLNVYADLEFCTNFGSLKEVPENYIDEGYFCPVVATKKEADGFMEGEVYNYNPDNASRFNIGSYSTFASFRRVLSDFDNVGDFNVFVYSCDSEGVFGPYTSMMMAATFMKYRTSFVEYIYQNRCEDDASLFVSIYDCFMEAFEIASKTGAVEFC